MRGFKLELLAGVAAIATGFLLPVALEADPMGNPPPPPHRESFQQIDTNHDGKISAEEWKAATDASFKAEDTNGDGFISRDEMIAFAQTRLADRVDRTMKQLDTDKDGKISKAEFEAGREKMRERMEARKGKMGGPEGPPPPPGGPDGPPPPDASGDNPE